MNKKFSFLAVFSVLALVGAGCTPATTNTDVDTSVSVDGGDVASEQEGLDGTWVIKTATGDFASINEGTKYIFAGTKLTTKLGLIESKGDITSMDESSFTVLFEGMSNSSSFNYRFEGSNLILEPSGSKQVFTLERR